MMVAEPEASFCPEESTRGRGWWHCPREACEGLLEHTVSTVRLHEQEVEELESMNEKVGLDLEAR